MAETDSSDLLMVVKPKGKVALEGESATVYDKNDTTMMQNFLPQRFCEIQDFTFGVGIEDNEGSEKESTDSTGAALDNELHSRRGTTAVQADKSSKGSDKKKSKRFKFFLETGMLPPSPNRNNPNRRGYEISLDEVTITRLVDRMSVPLIKLWFDQTPLDYVVIVKRKFTGNRDYHEAYLRLQFSEALITAVDWEEGDVMIEKVKFIYRSATIAYKPQKADGTLAEPISVPVTYDVEAT